MKSTQTRCAWSATAGDGVSPLVGELVRAEASAGRLDAAVPLDDLPYVLVRIMVSYIYLGLLTGEDPDPDRAARVISPLLPRGAGPLPSTPAGR